MDFFELVATYVSLVPLIFSLAFAWGAIETYLEERSWKRDG